MFSLWIGYTSHTIGKECQLPPLIKLFSIREDGILTNYESRKPPPHRCQLTLAI